jgi:prolipoprotein diacylglyceryltransferase
MLLNVLTWGIRGFYIILYSITKILLTFLRDLQTGMLKSDVICALLSLSLLTLGLGFIKQILPFCNLVCFNTPLINII